MNLEADLVVLANRILTWWEEAPEAQGVAMGAGRILAVGSRAEARGWAGPDTTVLDVGSRLALPGFVDSHTHLATVGAERRALDLRSATSREELAARVQRRAQTLPPGAWVVGRNWDESRWPVRAYPTREDLDRAAPHHPTALSRVDMHMAAANTAALDRLELEGLPGVEVDEAGRPTGVLKEEAFEALLALTRPGPEAVVEGIEAMGREAHRLGVTSISDVVRPAEVAAYLRLQRSGRLPLRVNLMPRLEAEEPLRQAGLSTGLGGTHLRLGALKAFMDGSLGARTAALSEAYTDDPGNRGRLMYDEGEIQGLLRAPAEAGFQLALHAIGDRGIDLALRCLSSAPAARHRVEHLELPHGAHLKALASQGLVASMQPNFIGAWSRPGGMYEDRLGKERLRGNNPLRRVLEAGIPLAFGSDMMPFGPLLGLHWAVNAPFEDQRVSPEEALRAYTLGGAYAMHQEAVKGSLEPGKLADVAVLEADPREKTGGIKDIPVYATILDGAVVYQAS